MRFSVAGKSLEGMDPYAQRYGGHQFGNWAGQLGDGRAITLGEVDTGTGGFGIATEGLRRHPVFPIRRREGRIALIDPGVPV